MVIVANTCFLTERHFRQSSKRLHRGAQLTTCPCRTRAHASAYTRLRIACYPAVRLCDSSGPEGLLRWYVVYITGQHRARASIATAVQPSFTWPPSSSFVGSDKGRPREGSSEPPPWTDRRIHPARNATSPAPANPFNLTQRATIACEPRVSGRSRYLKRTALRPPRACNLAASVARGEGRRAQPGRKRQALSAACSHPPRCERPRAGRSNLHSLRQPGATAISPRPSRCFSPIPGLAG